MSCLQRLLAQTRSAGPREQAAAMVTITEVVSRRSLDFRNQRKAYLLRHVDHLPWASIAGKVVNLQNQHPSWVTVRTTVRAFNVAKGCRPSHYARSGRKAWKLTPEVRRFVIQRLLRDRVAKVVTSATLQADLAAEMGVALEASTIRKFLQRRGYSWLPRSQKRKYSLPQRRTRVAFAAAALALRPAALRQKLAMSMDGIVLSMPPETDIDRLNYCWGGVTHMWRKAREAKHPRLAADDEFQKQVPLSRALPLWGGISEGGFASVLWHLDRKKTNTKQWAAAVDAGKLTNALRQLNPRNQRGPWHVLCDNETFLRTKASLAAYRRGRVVLWDVPAKSPDLNPVERFWAWLRKKLRQMDLADLRARRAPLTKPQYATRVPRVLQTRKAQSVVKRCAGHFRTSCQKVLDNRGAAAGN